MSLRRVHAFVIVVAATLAGCAELLPQQEEPFGPTAGAAYSAERSYRLALRYLNGDGVAPDERRATRLLMEAADAGHASAQFLLAEAYENARGVSREPAWATMWYGRAAQQGHGEAQFRLALAYANGRGTDQDIIEAYKWLSIAAGGGHENAARAREALSGRMIREEIVPAEKAAATWAPADRRVDPDKPLVRFVQFALTQLGHDCGGSDGIVGRRTRAAIDAFARDEGIEGDAITPALVERLRVRLRTQAQADMRR